MKILARFCCFANTLFNSLFNPVLKLKSRRYYLRCKEEYEEEEEDNVLGEVEKELSSVAVTVPTVRENGELENSYICFKIM